MFPWRRRLWAPRFPFSSLQAPDPPSQSTVTPDPASSSFPPSAGPRHLLPAEGGSRRSCGQRASVCRAAPRTASRSLTPKSTPGLASAKVTFAGHRPSLGSCLVSRAWAFLQSLSSAREALARVHLVTHTCPGPQGPGERQNRRATGARRGPLRRGPRVGGERDADPPPPRPQARVCPLCWALRSPWPGPQWRDRPWGDAGACHPLFPAAPAPPPPPTPPPPPPGMEAISTLYSVNNRFQRAGLVGWV